MCRYNSTDTDEHNAIMTRAIGVGTRKGGDVGISVLACALPSLTFFICCEFGPLQNTSGPNLMSFQQGCGAVTFLVGSGSGEAIRLRLRLRVKLFCGSGSGSGQNVPAPAAPAPAPMIKSSYEP